MKKILLLVSAIVLINCNGNAQKETKKESKTYKVTKTDAEWKSQLTALEYHVLREEGTETAFSSPLNANYKEGIYVCKACNTPLFKSDHKFDSGTGWPSFDREIKGNVIISNGSEYYGLEEHCAVCGGHLGHVFNDGPKNTTGKRHCINGVALKFIPKND
ncbi:peptide-methionine (R)-S-oxide reductase MsrB [Confluentibacter flavum]|uniref:peptide-methionine (R)-S-oxide reductase n=1 Tax=Confluentibacter flavum TaxID=1909700 RepID=A0A2N3HH30_9FLAO|nr:peptide-methionine (R)-S-oxide reductase MsrB [Confluentibacter flavum]PKQ44108.1 peptide-methionine (R)-S-oxide reductase [Confluentibacter flavum]